MEEEGGDGGEGEMEEKVKEEMEEKVKDREEKI